MKLHNRLQIVLWRFSAYVGQVIWALLFTAGFGSASASDKLVVLTSYAQPLTVRFQTEFERLYPGKRMEVLWRQSSDALAYLQRTRGEVDVYWSPAPGNFALLTQEGRFVPLSLDHKVLPGQIGGSPISDPGDHFAAFELAGHGIAYNKEVLRRLRLPEPRDWADLTDPAYAGQVQIPIPGRIGFAPVLIETILQAYGWDGGWALLSEIAGNADFGGHGDHMPAADEIASGAKAARLTIDFFAATAIANGASMGFVYPPKTAYNPAHIAVFSDAPNPGNARLFVDFVLSEQGQSLLLHPDVRRLPVLKAMYDKHPDLPARPFAADGLGYDAGLARDRQGLVAALFEVALVRRHTELASLWAELHRAEASNLQHNAALRKARHLLTAAPIAEASQSDVNLRESFAYSQPMMGAAQQHSAENAVRSHSIVRWESELQSRIAAIRHELQTAKR